MEVQDTLSGKYGFKKYDADPIKVTTINIPPKLIIEMNNWKDAARIVYETLLVLTNEGQQGILITGPQLSKVTVLSVPSVFNALRFLLDNEWIKKEKYPGYGNPNIIFVNNEQIEKVSGDLNI
jgi:predicted transcriptional regulator